MCPISAAFRLSLPQHDAQVNAVAVPSAVPPKATRHRVGKRDVAQRRLARRRAIASAATAAAATATAAAAASPAQHAPRRGAAVSLPDGLQEADEVVLLARGEHRRHAEVDHPDGAEPAPPVGAEEQVAGVQVGVHQVVREQHLVVDVDASLYDVVPLRNAELPRAAADRVVGRGGRSGEVDVFADGRARHEGLNQNTRRRRERRGEEDVAPSLEVATHQPQPASLLLERRLPLQRPAELLHCRLRVEPAQAGHAVDGARKQLEQPEVRLQFCPDTRVANLDRHRTAVEPGEVDLADGSAHQRLVLPRVKVVFDARSGGRLDLGARDRGGVGGRVRVQDGERLADRRRDEVRPRRRPLAPLCQRGATAESVPQRRKEEALLDSGGGRRRGR
mmetsp:Transcript_36499/g.117935  ORF Transcript_36499/g.117935 Transcript_36499/m.117935 type:complete len:391 (+) Transcript_36499:392-1564(+)